MQYRAKIVIFFFFNNLIPVLKNLLQMTSLNLLCKPANLKQYADLSLFFFKEANLLSTFTFTIEHSIRGNNEVS